MKRFILVGADPGAGNVDHPGGQLTASDGLIRYARQQGFTIDVIDTTQSSFPVPSLKVRFKKGLSRFRRLNRMLSASKYEGVIIFSSSGFSFYERILLAALCRLKGVKAMFFMRSGHFINAINASRFQRRLSSWLLKIPFRIGAQGRPWVDFYQSLGISDKKLCIVRNWISFDFPIAQQPRNSAPTTRINFVFVGWLVEAKGIPQLLAAAEKLKDRYQFTLTLIGGGTLSELAKHKAEADLADHLKVLGWQDSKQVQQHLAAADVFVLPSAAEGFPNALLEAMATGLPSICTDVGAISDSLHDNVNGFLLEDNNTECIVRAMEAYLKQPELITLHSRKTLEIFNQQHGWEANCAHLFDQFGE